jgi:hypothetical protein
MPSSVAMAATDTNPDIVRKNVVPPLASQIVLQQRLRDRLLL